MQDGWNKEKRWQTVKFEKSFKWFLYDGVERQDEKKIFGHISKAVWNVKMKKKIKQNPYNSNFKFRFEHFSLSWYKVHFFKKMNIVLNRHNHPVLLLITRRNTWQTPLKKRKLNKKTSYTSTNAERNDRSINH